MADAPKMVFLGFGKYVRSDRIYAVEPLVDDERGSGARTRVWVEGIPEPLIASRPSGRSWPRWARCRPAASCAAGREPLLNLRRSPHEVAPELIGAELLVDGVGGLIVEVEAYDHEDPAAHGFRNRRTPRNASMFLAGGVAYVYRSYGVHWCLNVVCCEAGTAGAVLIRALEPTHGLERMAERRGLTEPRLLCSGPGRLCQALAVTHEHDGLRLDRPPFSLRARRGDVEIVTGTRIGITKAADRPWRYGLAGSRFVSRPFRGR